MRITVTDCFGDCPFFHSESEYTGGFSCTISDVDVERWSESIEYNANHATIGPPPDCPMRVEPVTFELE